MLRPLPAVVRSPVGLAWLTLLAATGLLFVLGNYRLIDGGKDFQLRYREAQYVLQGIDPFRIASEQLAPSPEIGPLIKEAGQPPWVYTYCVIAFGWLTENQAKLALGVFNAAVLAWILIGAHRRLQPFQSSESSLCLLPLGGLFCTVYLINAVSLANFDFWICALCWLFIAAEQRGFRLPAGALFGLMMIKPTLVVCLGFWFLRQRRFVGLSIAVGLVLGAWFAASQLLSMPMLDLLSQMSAKGSEFSRPVDIGMAAPFLQYGLGDAQSVVKVYMLLGFAVAAVALTLYHKAEPAAVLGWVLTVGQAFFYSRHNSYVTFSILFFQMAVLMSRTPVTLRTKVIFALTFLAFATPGFRGLYAQTPLLGIAEVLRYSALLAGALLVLRESHHYRRTTENPTPARAAAPVAQAVT
ncbi:MAG: glycosyltransferase family 87 protein [Opitutales bacterium]